MIDSHCHFDFSVFDADRTEILQGCAAAGITGIIVPGIQPSQWQPLLSLLTALSRSVSPCRLWAAVGVHPWWVEALQASFKGTETAVKPFCKQQLQDALAQPHVVAVGECGLDGSLLLPLEQQLPVFEWQLQVAADVGLPLILHGHKAHNEILRLLSHYRPAAGGVIHAFSGSEELARQYWRLGFYLGVGGTITYPRASKTRRAIRAMPLESLLLETDAPDMPLNGYQGQRNSPLRLPQIARCLAELREEPLARIQQQTTHNTRRLFALGE